MVPPSPDLLRKYRNTEEIIKSGRIYLIPDLIKKYPHDYIDQATFKSIKKILQT